MASLDSLPADQRAVLQLVLQRGRTYDDIAQLLSIDRVGVRDRALKAFDALGPQTRVPAERRALITDYLLGQLPSRVSEQTRDRLAESASERAWVRVVGSELAPLAKDPLPEIPVEAAGRGAEPAEAAATPASTPAAQAEPVAAGAAASGPPTGGDSPDDGPRNRDGTLRTSSRRGGAILLGLGALVVVIVVIVILAVGGRSSKTPTTAASTPSTPATTTTPAAGTPTTPSATTGSARTASGAKLIAQVNLTSPAGTKNTAGVAQVIKSGANQGLVIVAQGVPANHTHDAYAVWLYNSLADFRILGFVNPGVKADGKLQTAGVLPATASHFKLLLVTLETQAKPHGPGKVVLQGALNLH